MSTQQIFARICLALSLVAMVTGCSALHQYRQNEIAGSTTDYNMAMGKAQNEMLFLNIVRAYKRHPMYFSVLTDVKGSLTYTLQTGPISAPFAKFNTTPKGGATTYFTVGPSASYTTNPIFDTALLNSKEFVHGMMEPVQPETFEYYWQQGWPKAMLLYLFIDRIQKDQGPTYDNHPYSKSFDDFEKQIDGIVDESNHCGFTVSKEHDPIGPEIEASDAADLKELVEVKKADLELVPQKKSEDGKKVLTYQLESHKKEYTFECKREKNEGQGGIISNQYKLLSTSQSEVTGAAKMYLRSPEAILYYLGEIMRAEKDIYNTPLR